MFKLNESKENLLEKQYGFQKNVFGENNIFYRFGKGLTIYSIEHIKHPGQVECTSFSRRVQDLLYSLIKDDVLIVVPNENKTEQIIKLQEKIEQLKQRIKKLEGN